MSLVNIVMETYMWVLQTTLKSTIIYGLICKYYKICLKNQLLFIKTYMQVLQWM
jgi:hypothetical protein